MFSKLVKLPSEHKAILLGAIIIILVGLFYRHNDYPQMYARVGAGVGRLKGSVNLEAFEQGGGGPTMVLFYAPWCGHCKKLEPVWDEFSSNGPQKCKYVKINCDEDKDMASKYGIEGYPTIKYLSNGLEDDPSNAVDYTGERSLDGLTSFVNQTVSGNSDEMPD